MITVWSSAPGLNKYLGTERLVILGAEAASAEGGGFARRCSDRSDWTNHVHRDSPGASFQQRNTHVLVSQHRIRASLVFLVAMSAWRRATLVRAGQRTKVRTKTVSTYQCILFFKRL